MLLIESLLAGGTIPTTPLLFVWGSGEAGNLANFDSSGNLIDTSGVRSWSSVVAGNDHVLAIRNDGLLFVWGQNSFGQLGSGNVGGLLNSPTQLGTSSWVSISAGPSISTAIRQGGTLFTWGVNQFGQLGLGDTANRSSPTQVGTSSWTALALIPAFSPGRNAAIRQGGTLFVWGNNEFGQIGDGTLTARSSPMQIGTSSWVSVSLERSNTAAVRQGGTLFAWGGRTAGRLGNYIVGVTPPTWTSWRQVGLTLYFGLGVDSLGRLYSWGNNSQGQLGLGDRDTRGSPTQIGTSSWTTVSASEFTALAVRQGGTLFSWGNNSAGQLGLEDTTFRSSPTQVGTSSWTALANSNFWSAAVRQGGTVFMWGDLSRMVLVDAGFRSSPVQIGINSYTQISAGLSQIYAIASNNTLWTWGENSFGSAGLADQSGQVNIPKSWVQVAAGRNHNLIRSNTGELWSWGEGTQGQLGRDNTFGPSQIPGSWIFCDAGQFYSAAIRNDGRLFTFGLNSAGQLGLGDTESRSSPTQVGTSSWTQVSVNNSITAAIRQGGTLFTWGWNNQSQLGLNDTINRSSPVQVSTISYTQVRMGFTHGVAIDNTSKLWTWGQNQQGQLGNFVGGAVAFGLGSWTAINTTLTGNNAGGIRNGRLLLWGTNQFGQLGYNNIEGGPSPNTIFGSWTQIESGEGTFAAIDNLGRLYTWGQNNVGQLGLGDTTNRSSPTQVGTSSWTAVTTERSTMMAIRRDGSLWVWGSNRAWVFGIPFYDQSAQLSSPALVSTSSWSAVSMGAKGVLAIRQGGTLFSWGDNDYGQNGNFDTSDQKINITSWRSIVPGNAGTGQAIGLDALGRIYTWGYQTASLPLGGGDSSSSRSRPQMISESSWTAITAGYYAFAAIRQDGALFVWGVNDGGQLGLGDATTRTLPTQLGTSSWTAVSMQSKFEDSNTLHTLAIRQGGTLFSWGRNQYGQLGNGNITGVSSPVQIGSSSWIAISAGYDQSLAIRQGGTLFTWGRNNSGQLGLNDTINRSSPVQVGSSSWSVISGGYVYSAAIRQGGTLFTWGQNAGGEIGDGGATSRSSPHQIGSSSWTTVNAGVNATLAVLSNGRLFGWGLASGNNGLNGSNVSSPNVIGSSSYTAVAGNNILMFAVASNSWGWVWGQGFYGGQGRGFSTGTFQLTSSPVLLTWRVPDQSPVQLGTSSWSVISAGFESSMAIRQGGTLFSWGNNGFNRILGLTDSIDRSSPVQVGTASWSQVSLGTSFAIAISNTGAGWGWGSDQWGAAGGGSGSTIKSEPTLIGGPAGTAGQSYALVSAGNTNGFFIQGPSGPSAASGALWGAGLDQGLVFGQTFRSSYSTVASRDAAEPIQIGSSSWIAVAAGRDVTGGVTSDLGGFNVRVWGWNTQGILGLGDTINRSSPVQVSVLDGRGITIKTFTWMVESSIFNGIFMWGENFSGQCDNNDPSSYVTNPGLISFMSPVTYAVGESTTAAVRIVSGAPTFFWWGGWFGNPNYAREFTFQNQSSPVLASVWSPNEPNQIGSASDWGQVSAGQYHAIALKNAAPFSIWTWGLNSSGQLGHNDTNNRSSPTLITNNVSRVMASATRSQWVDTVGQLIGTGTNSEGQLGIGTRTNVSSPVIALAPVGGAQASAIYRDLAKSDQNAQHTWAFVNPANIFQPSSFQAVGMGRAQNDTTGLWYQAYGGSVGQGSPWFTDAHYEVSPIQVNSSSWTAVAWNNGVGITAINSTGALWSWGAQTATGGTLGLGSTLTEFRGSPVVINNSSSYTAVSTGDQSVLARKINGTLDGWGIAAGIFGVDPLGTSRATPAAAAAGSWVSVSASLYGALGILNTNVLYGWGQGVGSFGQGYSPIVAGIPRTPQIIYDATRFSPVQVGTLSWRQVSIGTIHTLAIRSDGLLYGWGNNASGQLGNGNTINASSPVQIGTSNWFQVSAGGSFSMAIRADRTLWAWGLGSSGQLGLNSSSTVSSPVQVGTSSWNAVSAARGFYSMALRSDNTLWSWGNNNSGQLGLGVTTTISSPVQVGTSSWTIVSVGLSSSMAIRQGGTLFSWGSNFFGNLGLDDFINRSSPVQVGASSWAAVSLGVSHSLAVRQNGTLFAWGMRLGGVLGTGNTDGATFTSLAASGLTTFFINPQGQLFGTGNNTSGQLGLGDTLTRLVPEQIPGSWTMISVPPGNNTVLGIRSNGTLWSWGANSSGTLGLGDTANRSSPTQVGTSIWTTVSTGLVSTLAIRQGGTLFCWGNGFAGAVGDNAQVNRSSPVQLGSSSWTTIHSGAYEQSAIRQGGNLFTWGYNPFGGLGLGDTFARSSPVQVGTSVWTAAGGSQYAGAWIRQGGTLFTSGFNNSGQLGLGDTANRSSPTQVGTNSWTIVSGNGNGTLQFAITNTGQLWGWGVNSNAQIVPDFITRSSPVQVTSVVGSWTAVSGGSTNTFGIVSPGIAYAWGARNSSFGDGQTSGTITSPTLFASPWQFTAASPVQVGSLSWVAVSATESASSAIGSNNLLYTWGMFNNGILGGPGSGSYIARSSPVQVGNSSWTAVAMGPYTVAAITK